MHGVWLEVSEESIRLVMQVIRAFSGIPEHANLGLVVTGMDKIPNLNRFLASLYFAPHENEAMQDYFVLALEGSHPELTDEVYRRARLKDDEVWDRVRKKLPVPEMESALYDVRIAAPFQVREVLQDGYLLVAGPAVKREVGVVDNLRKWWLENSSERGIAFGRALIDVYYSSIAAVFRGKAEYDWTLDPLVQKVARVHQSQVLPLPKTYRIEHRGVFYLIEDPPLKFYGSYLSLRQIYDHFRFHCLKGPFSKVSELLSEFVVYCEYARDRKQPAGSERVKR